MRGDRLLLAAGTTVLGMIGPVCAVAEEVDGGVGLIISGRVGRSVSAGAGVRIGVCVVARVVLGGGRFAPARGGCGLCCGGTGIIVTVGLLTGVLATGGDQGGDGAHRTLEPGVDEVGGHRVHRHRRRRVLVGRDVAEVRDEPGPPRPVALRPGHRDDPVVGVVHRRSPRRGAQAFAAGAEGGGQDLAQGLVGRAVRTHRVGVPGELGDAGTLHVDRRGVGADTVLLHAGGGDDLLDRLAVADPVLDLAGAQVDPLLVRHVLGRGVGCAQRVPGRPVPVCLDCGVLAITVIAVLDNACAACAACVVCAACAVCADNGCGILCCLVGGR